MLGPSDSTAVVWKEPQATDQAWNASFNFTSTIAELFYTYPKNEKFVFALPLSVAELLYTPSIQPETILENCWIVESTGWRLSGDLHLFALPPQTSPIFIHKHVFYFYALNY